MKETGMNKRDRKLRVFEISKTIKRLKHVIPWLLQKKCAEQKAAPRAEGKEQGLVGTGSGEETGEGHAESAQVLGEEGAKKDTGGASANYHGGEHGGAENARRARSGPLG